MSKKLRNVLKSSAGDGFFYKNPLFISGMVIGPVVAILTTIKTAAVFVAAFSAVTILTVLICSFFSRRIVYAIRIILYTIIASLVYVLVLVFMKQTIPNEVSNLGIYLPLLVTNSLIVSRTELRFFRRSKLSMIPDVFGFVAGFDIAVLAFAFVREILAYGAVGGTAIGIGITFPILAYPFGGFILLGLMSALFRKIVITVISTQNQE